MDKRAISGRESDAVMVARYRYAKKKAYRAVTTANQAARAAQPQPAVIEEKREPVIEKPKVDKGDGRVPVRFRVDFGDRVFEVEYRTNMRNALMVPQMSDAALAERFTRIVKEHFGGAR